MYESEVEVTMAETTTAKPRRQTKTAQTETVAAPTEKAPKRKIPGSLPYTSSAGVLRRVLEKIPVSERPSVFTTDFLSTVMNASGGAARPIPTILKATGLLNQNASPTELYAQFQTQGGRPAAANQALRNGFGEIFKRNTYAHKVNEATLLDLITSVTGLPKTTRSFVIYFQHFKHFRHMRRISLRTLNRHRKPNDARSSRPIPPQSRHL
jgi:hypothetical protein